MFFRKKNEVQKADWETRMRRVAAKYNTTYDAIDHLTGTILEHRQGIIELLKRADQDNNEEKIKKTLDISDGGYYI
ncbi:MAG: hypothetical protein J7L37_02300 [Thermococcus sp.]|nr:hypothetical protein [Thermococcus sp.]